MSLKINVGHSVNRYLPVTENWIYKQLINLKKCRPIVIARKRFNNEMFPLNSVYCLNDLTKIENYTWRALRRFTHSNIDYYLYVLKKMNVSLLHSHFGDRGFFDIEMTRKLKIPHITTFYGYDVNMLPCQDSIWKERYAQLFDECDLFLTEGNYMKQYLTTLGCPESKIIVHHIGVDLNKIPFKPRTIGSDGKINVLAAGTFTEKKGLPYAIEAFAMVKRRHPDLNLRFTLIGNVPNLSNPRFSKVKDAIFKVIEKYRIRNSVQLLGYVSYQRFLLEAEKANIFISPSIVAPDGDTEGGAPVSIIEMSASGLPILSTFHCDIPEVVINGETGFLVPERNVEVLADRLEYLVSHPEIWPRMGERARKYIEQEYHLIKQVRKLELIYQSLILNNK